MRTDSPLTMLQAEADHRRHAIVEQVIADLKNGPLAHLPSGRFNANGAWLVLATMAFNLTRAAGTLASRFWPWAADWLDLFTAALGPPTATAA